VIVAVFSLVVSLALLGAVPAHAQPFEASAYLSTLEAPFGDGRQWGGGARFGVQVAPWVVVEGDVARLAGGDARAGSLTQLFGGVKVGGRAERFGLFAKLRPGLVQFGNDFLAPGVVCIAVFPPPESCLAARTSVAFDLGTVVEMYPTRRTLLRVDLGSTHIWYRPRGDGDSERRGAFQVSVGAGVRF
jgi:hypothetical protein